MRKYKTSLFLVFCIVVLSTISLFIGAYGITIEGLFSSDHNQVLLLFTSRIPRLLALLCTGMGMSVAGLIMQNLCANKFISPTTGATITSAQLGVLITLLVFPTAPLFGKTLISFLTAIAGTWIFVWFIQRIPLKDVVMVPLIGIMFSSVLGGIISYYSYKYDIMQTMQNTLVGDFSLVMKGQYEIVFLVVPLIIVAFVFANHFNVVGMGENFSKNLGINYNLILFMGLTIAALITASIVVTVGSVSYIGLVIPNIVAIFKGDKIRGSLLDVALFGATYVLICDMIGRIVIAPYELPIDLISGILGSIIFLVLMFYQLQGNSRKKKRKDSTTHA